MGDRGRKSANELSVVKFDPERLPRPPAHLPAEVQAEWEAIVPMLTATDRSRWSLIESYCKHSVAQRHIGQLIQELEGNPDFDVARYDKLLKMQERESRAMASLAIRLGIAQSSSYERQKRNSGGARPPWQFEG